MESVVGSGTNLDTLSEALGGSDTKIHARCSFINISRLASPVRAVAALHRSMRKVSHKVSHEYHAVIPTRIMFEFAPC